MLDLSALPCPGYQLVASVEALLDPAVMSSCFAHVVSDFFAEVGEKVTDWNVTSCLQQVVFRPQNTVTKAFGFDSLAPPIIDQASTFCNINTPNIYYMAAVADSSSVLAFGSVGSVGYADFFKGKVYGSTPSAWGLSFEKYQSGDLPYGRSPGVLNVACQIGYRDDALSAVKVISASASVPNVLSTSIFRKYSGQDVYSTNNDSWITVVR